MANPNPKNPTQTKAVVEQLTINEQNNIDPNQLLPDPHAIIRGPIVYSLEQQQRNELYARVQAAFRAQRATRRRPS